MTKAKENAGVCVLEDDGEVPAKNAAAELHFEDVGGQPVEDIDELPEAAEPRVPCMPRLEDKVEIQKLLGRDLEMEAMDKPGRHAEAHVHMESVIEVFGSTLKDFLQPFQVISHDCLQFHRQAEQVLECQKRRAESIRCNLVGCEDFSAEDNADEHIAGEPSASLFDLDQIRQGPREVAWQLVQSAGLNADQIHAVALIAWPMQQKWEEHRGTEESMLTLAKSVENQLALLPLVGVLVRLLLVGGGGCGKSRIINRVVSPLLRCFYGSRGLLLEASSNKAARLIGGVTIHAANSLRGNSSLMTVHLRLSPNKQKVAERRYACLDGKVFDEFS